MFTKKIIDMFSTTLKPFATLTLFILLFSVQVFSQTFTKLFDFEEADGSRSYSELISDGTYFYGMTHKGGTNNGGTIFKIKTDGTDFEKLHDFHSTTGENPYNSLTLIGSELYGTTFRGGSNNGGVIFKVGIDGSDYTVLANFQTTEYPGYLLESSLYFDGTFLYGTTYSGGGGGGGTLYRIKPDGSDFSTQYVFSLSSGSGTQPNCDLWFDGTYFYGVNFNGGEHGDGTIYKIKPDGTDFIKLHDFIDNHNNTNVSSAGVILYEDYLYGNTFLGEDDQYGYIYKIKTDGTDFTILHHFTPSIGIKPAGELVMHNGFLYGTTSQGSPSSIFRIKPDGTDFSVVHQFTADSGHSAWAGLIEYENSLYGITTSGGSHGHGTIYKFTAEILDVIDPEEKTIKIYPNPTQNYLHLELSSFHLGKEINIYDNVGRSVWKEKAGNLNQRMDVSSLPSGIYFLQIGNERHKIIKK